MNSREIYVLYTRIVHQLNGGIHKSILAPYIVKSILRPDRVTGRPVGHKVIRTSRQIKTTIVRAYVDQIYRSRVDLDRLDAAQLAQK